MKRLKRSTQGFTLIELMIVVAIIGVLAAMAIPQFAAYRMRAFNATAESDLRNVKTAEEVLMHDGQIYGSTEANKTLPGSGGAGGGKAQGNIIMGQMAAGNESVAGAILSGTDVNGDKHGVGIGISNSVQLRADTMQGDASFTTYAHHFQGNRVFAGEAESTAVFVCESKRWIGKTGLVGDLAIPAVTTDGDLMGKACNGTTVSNWTPL